MLDAQNDFTDSKYLFIILTMYYLYKDSKNISIFSIKNKGDFLFEIAFN